MPHLLLYALALLFLTSLSCPAQQPPPPTSPGYFPGPDGRGFGPSSPFLVCDDIRLLEINDEITLEAVIKTGGLQKGGGVIACNQPFDSRRGFRLDTYPQRSLRFVTGHVTLTAKIELTKDTYTHVVATYSSREKFARLYLNGQLVASASGGDFPPLLSSLAPLRLGADLEDGSRFYGRIRQFAVYRRALELSEIQARAKVIEPPHPAGIVAEWRPVMGNAESLTSVVGSGRLLASTGSATSPATPPQTSTPQAPASK